MAGRGADWFRQVESDLAHARGDAHPGSDADLFVVVWDAAGPLRDRIPAIARHFTGVGCDVLVYTEAERAGLAGRFAQAVLDAGIPLAARGSVSLPCGRG